MKKLFLDDERFPVSSDWIIVRSVEDAIAWVQTNGFPDFVSFDNDLGEGRREGWEFARWLVDNDLDTGSMPDSFDFYPHTQNPVARDRIEGILRQYLNHRSHEAKSRGLKTAAKSL